MKRIALSLLITSLLCSSCDGEHTVPVSEEMREKAYEISFQYIGMPYVWGGASHYSDTGGGVDCSGLVIEIYDEVAESFSVRLLFNDTTASAMANQYTLPLLEPERGDLIFMGEDGVVSHVALCHAVTDDDLVFIDAYSVTGEVGIRSYSFDDPKIISFGRMLVISD
ncbi:MAG: NlpC/P60 family protein [Sphaerochaetaceae bacterium]|nr:NlpC/P60 family protein [uncultured Sphaerochaeta sp.]MDC7230826.1 NlpC/P60 family protein [Sphaerochaetaceae bacterium]